MFIMRYRSDGSLKRYKAGIMAKGYMHIYCVDYQEMFVPVAKIHVVIGLVSLVTSFDWYLAQFNVNNIFLHGNMEKEIFMDIIMGFKRKLRNNKM